MSFFVAMVFASCLVIITILIHYEVLRYTWNLLPRLNMPARLNVLVTVIASFSAHTIEVWVYAIAYMLAVKFLGLGELKGETLSNWHDYIYFSAVTYTSLGLGDVYPQGPVRLITGIEALNGLLLITWSASFTYLTMERYWSQDNDKSDRNFS